MPRAIFLVLAATLKGQPMHLHDAADALWIGRCAPGLQGLPAEQRMNAAIAVGWQLGDKRTDASDQLGVR